jgi:hypothetical protein
VKPMAGGGAAGASPQPRLDGRRRAGLEDGEEERRSCTTSR